MVENKYINLNVNECIYLYKECNNKEAFEKLKKIFFETILNIVLQKIKIFNNTIYSQEDYISHFYNKYIEYIDLYDYRKKNNFIPSYICYSYNDFRNLYRKNHTKKKIGNGIVNYDSSKVDIINNIDFFEQSEFKILNKKLTENMFDKTWKLFHEYIKDLSDEQILKEIIRAKYKNIKLSELSQKLNISSKKLNYLWRKHSIKFRNEFLRKYKINLNSLYNE